MKKKTHEEYITELEIKNPNLEVIGKYINTNIKILHRCKKHNVIWEITPSRALNGSGCEECRKEKFRNTRTKSTQEYIEEVNVVNPDIIVVEDYIDSKTPILHRCKKHDIEWKALPSNVLKGNGCVECGKEKISLKNSKTHEQYIDELKIINPNISVIDKYINSETPILHRCLIDDYEWMARPGNILYGKGCPKCAGNLRITTQEYNKRLSKINSNIIALENYENSHVKIRFRCLIDGYEWQAEPASVLQGCGCPRCAGNLRKTNKQYISELQQINPDLEVIEEYINSKTPILHKCKKHNIIYKVTPERTLSGGSGCVLCNESIGERKIRQWFENRFIHYVYQYMFQDCRDKHPLPFDFYLPDYNICVEFDGKHHFEPVDFANKGTAWANESLEYIQYHDNIKTKYCKDNDIGLLRIPYFKNIEEELNNYLFI